MSIIIEKLIHGGQGLGKHENGKVALVWNALPGEEVGYMIISKNRDYIEGIADRIIQPSPHRLKEKEEHFLSCSPWQILEYSEELKWKVDIAQETFKQLGKFDIELDIYSDQQQWGYRNKMEYSFAYNDQGELSLAFFKRGKKRKIPIDPCCLAIHAINISAVNILCWLRQCNVTAEQLKTLVLRCNKQGEVIMALFVKDHIQFSPYHRQKHELGFHIFYSNPQSPASIVTEVLHEDGNQTIQEKLFDTVLEYGILSFFQVNTQVFEQALADMSTFVNKNDAVLDCYSGVGTIGLCITKSNQPLTLIESNEEAYEMSLKNVLNNYRENVHSILSPSEKVTEYIKRDQVMIVDPPRAGLHKEMIRKVNEIKPKTIIYLSCNVSTQARDVGQLLEVYDVKFAKLYNFFPRTPHIESLFVLQCR